MMMSLLVLICMCPSSSCSIRVCVYLSLCCADVFSYLIMPVCFRPPQFFLLSFSIWFSLFLAISIFFSFCFSFSCVVFTIFSVLVFSVRLIFFLAIFRFICFVWLNSSSSYAYLFPFITLVSLLCLLSDSASSSLSAPTQGSD